MGTEFIGDAETRQLKFYSRIKQKGEVFADFAFGD